MIRDIVREGRTDHSEKLMGKIATLNIAAGGSRLSVKEPMFLFIEYTVDGTCMNFIVQTDSLKIHCFRATFMMLT